MLAWVDRSSSTSITVDLLGQFATTVLIFVADLLLREMCSWRLLVPGMCALVKVHLGVMTVFCHVSMLK
jgi:hypothetical protein